MPSQIKRAGQLTYLNFTENGWRDGNDKKIKNWKLKARNILLHKRPWNFGSGKEVQLERDKAKHESKMNPTDPNDRF